MIITFDEDYGRIDLRKASNHEEPYGSISIEALVDIWQRSKWTPCSERLPEEEGRYLCTVNAELHQVRDMMYKPTPWGDGVKCKWKLQDGCYAFDWFVLAWMPLPEPYKESE